MGAAHWLRGECRNIGPSHQAGRYIGPRPCPSTAAEIGEDRQPRQSRNLRYRDRRRSRPSRLRKPNRPRAAGGSRLRTRQDGRRVTGCDRVSRWRRRHATESSPPHHLRDPPVHDRQHPKAADSWARADKRTGAGRRSRCARSASLGAGQKPASSRSGYLWCASARTRSLVCR